VGDVAKIIGFELPPIRQRRLVDVEHESGFGHLRRAPSYPILGRLTDRLQVALIVAVVVIGRNLVFEVAEIGRLKNRAVGQERCQQSTGKTTADHDRNVFLVKARAAPPNLFMLASPDQAIHSHASSQSLLL